MNGKLVSFQPVWFTLNVKLINMVGLCFEFLKFFNHKRIKTGHICKLLSLPEKSKNGIKNS